MAPLVMGENEGERPTSLIVPGPRFPTAKRLGSAFVCATMRNPAGGAGEIGALAEAERLPIT